MTVRDPGGRHPVDAGGDPLTFALAGLLGEPPGSVREYALEAVPFEAGEELEIVAPLAGRLRVTRTNRGIVVDARLRTALAGSCSRCLVPLVIPIEVRIDEEVLPAIELASGLPVAPEEGGDPEAARLTDHHELELRPLVREAVSLAEPIAPRCTPGCPGLCPQCGARLEPDHALHEEAIDPRLEALRGFRVDDTGDPG